MEKSFSEPISIRFYYVEDTDHINCEKLFAKKNSEILDFKRDFSLFKSEKLGLMGSLENVLYGNLLIIKSNALGLFNLIEKNQKIKMREYIKNP